MVISSISIFIENLIYIIIYMSWYIKNYKKWARIDLDRQNTFKSMAIWPGRHEEDIDWWSGHLCIKEKTKNNFIFGDDIVPVTTPNSTLLMKTQPQSRHGWTWLFPKIVLYIYGYQHWKHVIFTYYKIVLTFFSSMNRYKTHPYFTELWKPALQ